MNIRISKSQYSILLIAFFAGSTSAALATVYKGVDESGAVVYSDKPFENSEIITPPAITVMDAPKIAPAAPVEEEKPAEFKYQQFDIVTPNNDQVIWNEPNLMVSLRLKPGLNLDENHRIWLLVDGNAVAKNSESLNIAVGRLDRGTHQLQAEVRDKEGKIIVRTRPVIVHIKQTALPTPRTTPK